MTIVIKKAEFLTSAANPNEWPAPGPPEVAFAGRSNVGKSSLINALTGRKKLVRISKTPGRTQRINFFSLNGDSLRLVDLPGYGFAKVPAQIRAGWRAMIEAYLLERQALAAVVVIMDIRRQPSSEDLMLMGWLRSHGLAIVAAITKADKLSKNQAAARLAKLQPLLAEYDQAPVAFSAVSGRGVDELWDRLASLTGLA